MGAVLAALPLDQYPLTVEVGDYVSQYGSDRHYRLALQQLLVGVEAGAPTMG